MARLLPAKPLLSGETINVILGELNPGQEVHITFDVTVDDPQNPATNAQVCNQGTVNGDNFANVFTGNYAVTEDDPAATFFALNNLSCDDGSQRRRQRRQHRRSGRHHRQPQRRRDGHQSG